MEGHSSRVCSNKSDSLLDHKDPTVIQLTSHPQKPLSISLGVHVRFCCLIISCPLSIFYGNSYVTNPGRILLTPPGTGKRIRFCLLCLASWTKIYKMEGCFSTGQLLKEVKNRCKCDTWRYLKKSEEGMF